MMIWLILSFSIYPLILLASVKWMSKIGRKEIEWRERGFGWDYAKQIEKIKDWPLILVLAVVPLGVLFLFAVVARSFVEQYSLFAVAFSGAFFLGHLFLCQELSYFAAAREELEALKRKEKQ